MTDLVMYCDGLCEPMNPNGWACWAWVLLKGTSQIHQDMGCLGHGPGMTNNLAEYQAVIHALQWLHDNAMGYGVRVRTDSQLVVRQLQGVYAVRSPAILPLYQEAMALVQVTDPALEWIPREQNTLADALTREAYAIARGSATRQPQPHEPALLDVLQRLDGMAQTVSRWEADFLDSIVQQAQSGRRLSPKQLAVVLRMCSTYLGEDTACALARHEGFDD